MKKILIIGNNASAYALAKRLSETNEIFVAPSSDALKEFATCLDIRENSITELLDFAMENNIDMTIPVSQTALQKDICTIFTDNKQQIFGPTAKASEIVYNKVFAKKTLYKLRIPTPKFGIFEKSSMAIDYLKNQSIPFVLKTNNQNSAAVLTSVTSAKKLIESGIPEKNKPIIIEDYIYGTPFAFYAITDGYKALPIGSSILYKHSLDGDGGQLTNGMGSCVPNYKLSVDNEYFLMDNVIYPALEYLDRMGDAYTGIIGVNGILTTDNNIQILGWQSFMQNCDTDGILDSLEENLYELFESCIIGSFSDEIESIKFNNKHSVSVVLGCKNKVNKENVINGIENIDEQSNITFFPLVTRNKYLEYEASYGENLILTSSAANISKACEKVYKDIKEIDFKGIYYRKDICKIPN